MTEDDFKKNAIRTEDNDAVTYDVRPFKDQQQDAVAVCLGALNFRLSINALNTSKGLVLLVDSAFVSTSQLDGFVENLKSAGLRVKVQKPE